MMNKMTLSLLAVILITSDEIKAANFNIDIKKFKFTPQQLTIKVGDTVTWYNSEKRQYHSVWFEQLGEEEPQYFFPDESYQRTFKQTGEFPYRCGPHKNMTGLIIIK